MKNRGFVHVKKILITVLIAMMLLQIHPQSVQAQNDGVPFPCDETYFLIRNDFLGDNNFETLNLVTGARNTLATYDSTGDPSGSGPLYYNAAGYNVTDNMIWGYDHNAQSLFRIDANYDITFYPNSSTGLPDTILYNRERMYQVGDISPAGELYITDGTVSEVYVVDVNPNSPTYLTLINTLSVSYVDFGDWAFHPYDGYLYALSRGNNVDSHLYRIDPDNASTTDLGAVTGDIPTAGYKNVYAHYMDNAGNLYVVCKEDYYRIYVIYDVADINIGDPITATGLGSMTYPGDPAFWPLRYSGDGAHCLSYSTDYGDAPDTYATTYKSDGAVHSVNTDLVIGSSVSQENDAPLILSGTQDDLDDGVNLPAIKTSASSYSATVTITNLTVDDAYLYGWIDFNRDGIFDNSVERSDARVIPAGTNGSAYSLTWSSIPGDITAGDTYVRIRLFGEDTNLTPSGHGGDGEVEDYPLTITVSVSSQDTLPNTGFAPLQETILAVQPEELAYKKTRMVLNIPSLGISEEIVGVPQTSNGWNIDWLGEHVGYLHGTAFPTWDGNTILTGHVWDADGSPGVFSQLKDLSYGDRVTIDAWGQKYIYEVRSHGLIEADDLSLLQQHSDYDMLTLLTCKDFDEESGQYLHRISVKAVLIDIENE